MELTKPHKAKTTLLEAKFPVFHLCLSSPTGPPSKVPHVSEKGEELEKNRMAAGTLLLSSATFIISIKKVLLVWG